VRFIRYSWNARGQPQRDQFISVDQGSHGSSTVGAGLTALPAFPAGFGVPFDWQHNLPSHSSSRHPFVYTPQAILEASL
ncbi:aspartate aminotransferase family protein, partial [Rhizobium ruizarguesonis]